MTSWAQMSDPSSGRRHVTPEPRPVVPTSSQPRRAEPRRRHAPIQFATSARFTQADKPGRCAKCDGTFRAGDTIAFGRRTGASVPVHAACFPAPVTVRKVAPP